MSTVFCFDLDGTVTMAEILPVIAGELGLTEEMRTLTDLTLAGALSFEASFRLRVAILKSVPLRTVQEIVAEVPLDPDIARFIRKHAKQCAIVTGNLDEWVSPLANRLGCRIFSSKARIAAGAIQGIEYVMHKSHPVQRLKETHARVIGIGESVNDLPMFEVADIGVAFGGVHEPVKDLVEISDYVVFDGGALCRLLSTLL